MYGTRYVRRHDVLTGKLSVSAPHGATKLTKELNVFGKTLHIKRTLISLRADTQLLAILPLFCLGGGGGRHIVPALTLTNYDGIHHEIE